MNNGYFFFSNFDGRRLIIRLLKADGCISGPLTVDVHKKIYFYGLRAKRSV